MTSEELIEKAEVEFKNNVKMYKEKLIKTLLEIDENETIFVTKIDEDWNMFREALSNLGMIQLFQDEEFVREL